MRHYLITLVIEAEEGHGSPARWEWEDALDLATPVSVIACTGIVDDPDDAQVSELHDRVGQVHRDLAAHLG
jgi:hypothetical protein